MENGLVSPAEEGTPQGGPLSPVLSNIVLNELQHIRPQSASRGTSDEQRDATPHDEAQAASEQGEECSGSTMGTEISGLQLHESQATEEALGAESGGAIQRAVRELTSRTRGISIVRMVHDLAEYLRGWIGYFGRCETPEVLAKLEKWLRRRLRSMVWKQWKRGTTRYRELRRRASLRRTPRKRRQLRWTVAPCQNSSAEHRSAQRLLRLARASRAHCSWLA